MHKVLQYISVTVWDILYHKSLDAIEQSVDSPLEFMLYENNPITNQYISIPKVIYILRTGVWRY